MMSNSASIFGPTPPNTTQAKIDGGMGLFWDNLPFDSNGDVPNFPIGMGNPALQVTMTMAFGSSINSLMQAYSAGQAPKIARIISLKGTLQLYMFGGAVAHVLAGMSKSWDSMYLYWVMQACIGLMGGSQSLVFQIIRQVWQDDPVVCAKKMRLPMRAIVGAVAVGPAISGLVARGPPCPILHIKH